MATEYKVRIKYDSSGNVTRPGSGGGGGGGGGESPGDKKQNENGKKQVSLLQKVAGAIGITAVIMKALQSLIEPLVEAVNYGVFVLFAEMVAILKSLVDGVAAIFSMEFWSKVGEWLMTQAENIWNFVVSIFEVGLEFLSGLGELLWNTIIKPAWQFLQNVGLWVWEQILKPAWEELSMVGQWIWEQILKPAWDYLASVGRWIWDQILKPAWDFLANVGQWVWDTIIKPGFDYLLNIGSLIWEHMKSAFKWSIDIGAKLWDWIKSKLGGFGSSGGGSVGTRAVRRDSAADGLYQLHAGETVGRGYTTSQTGSNQINLTINVGNGGDKSQKFAQEIAKEMMTELAKVQRF